jgi:hypothetical protein
MTTPTKAKRQMDEDVARIRAVKEAAKKRTAAAAARVKADDRFAAAQAELDRLISAAPDAQQGYLRSLTATGA